MTIPDERCPQKGYEELCPHLPGRQCFENGMCQDWKGPTVVSGKIQNAVPKDGESEIPSFLLARANPVPPPKGKLTLHDHLRAQIVERWTIINKVRRQSVAEHSWMVTVIAMFMYQDMVGFDRESPMEALTLMAGALFHDVTETRTGDWPTPGKRYVEKLSGMELDKMVQEDLMPAIPFIGGTMAPEIERFVKIADVLEAAAWIRENGVGEHARVIAGKMHSRLVELVERATIETGVDWYESTNRVLMALGAPIIHHNSWIHQI